MCHIFIISLQSAVRKKGIPVLLALAVCKKFNIPKWGIKYETAVGLNLLLGKHMCK